MTETTPALPELPAPLTQRQLQHWAFAKRLCETANVAEAYRDVFDPGEDLTPYSHTAGARLLKDPEVGQIVKSIAAPALVELGVSRNHALRRLLETIDSDITDYFTLDTKDDDGKVIRGRVMTPSEMRQLPFEKRRLIKKFTEREYADGSIKREFELESKGDALKLLAQIEQWVQPGNTTIINNETIVTFINAARQKHQERSKAALEAAATSKTIAQLARPEGVVIEHGK